MWKFVPSFNRVGTLQNFRKFCVHLTCYVVKLANLPPHLFMAVPFGWYFTFFLKPFFDGSTHLNLIHYCLAQNQFLQHVYNTLIGCKTWSIFSCPWDCYSQHSSLGRDMRLLAGCEQYTWYAGLQDNWPVVLPILAKLWQYSNSHTRVSR